MPDPTAVSQGCNNRQAEEVDEGTIALNLRSCAVLITNLISSRRALPIAIVYHPLDPNSLFLSYSLLYFAWFFTP